MPEAPAPELAPQEGTVPVQLSALTLPPLVLQPAIPATPSLQPINNQTMEAALLPAKNLQIVIQQLQRENAQLKEEKEIKKEFPEAENLRIAIQQLQTEKAQLKEEKEQLQKANEIKKELPEAENLQIAIEQLQRENAQLRKENFSFAAQLKDEKERQKNRSSAEELQKGTGNLGKKISEMQKELDWRRARNNSDDIKLDADTAHPNLSVAGDKKSLTHEPQPQKSPPNSERFDSTACVLGSEGFSDGKHYWEVDVESSTEWDLGVALKSIERKGKMSLSPKEGFWVLGQSGRDYWAKTDPWTRVIVQKKPKKIGVYFGYEERQVTFFSVTDMSVLFTFSDCSFSGEVCPFFKNSHKETTMRICSIKEE
nr:butyrophilin subfamily 1 member A1-like [Pelodiscus sinensis]|eukprot:XP_006113452.2 butyrophilin subfamily 1 member A1-like [Pelodiscus sinensis]